MVFSSKYVGAATQTSRYESNASQDISHSGDGGIYAELIQNRAFQANSSETATLDPWYAAGDGNIQLITNDASPLSDALPYSVSVTGNGGTVGISNPGWWGYSVQAVTYTGSFWAKGDYSGKFTAALHSNLSSEVYASTDIPVATKSTDGWQNYNFTFTPTVAPNANNTFTLTFDSAGAKGPLQFNLISLFPPTYNNRPNGMRIDLMEKLLDLTPSYLRFPGGNNLEGDSNTTNHWRWNETVGPLTQRPGRAGVWGYYNTDGIGLDEYFAWTEDLDAEPILAIWDGFYLLGPASSPDETQDIWVQDALNELEYVLGDESTPYGGLRCTNGHPEPYKLNYIEIGNEDNLGDGLSTYAAYRFNLFYTAIHSRYPNLTIISSTTELTQDQLPPGTAADYHQYTRPDYFVNQSSFFTPNTSAHQTLIGEFATVQVNIPPFPNGTLQNVNFSDPRAGLPFWIGSVAESVFLLGAERNADKILGASYAPLFQNLNSYAWAPDLIQFAADPANTTLSTSYQTLQLLANTRFTQTRPTNVTDQPGTPGAAPSADTGPVFWAAGSNTLTGAEILKLAIYNATTTPSSSSSTTPQQHHPADNTAPEFTDNPSTVPISATFAAVPAGAEAKLTVLSAQDANANATVFPGGADPLTKWTLTIYADEQGKFEFALPDLSVAVLETKGDKGDGYDGLGSFGGYGGCKGGGSRASYDWQGWVGSGQEGGGCGS